MTVLEEPPTASPCHRVSACMISRHRSRPDPTSHDPGERVGCRSQAHIQVFKVRSQQLPNESEILRIRTCEHDDLEKGCV